MNTYRVIIKDLFISLLTILLVATEFILLSIGIFCFLFNPPQTFEFPLFLFVLLIIWKPLPVALIFLFPFWLIPYLHSKNKNNQIIRLITLLLVIVEYFLLSMGVYYFLKESHKIFEWPQLQICFSAIWEPLPMVLIVSIPLLLMTYLHFRNPKVRSALGIRDRVVSNEPQLKDSPRTSIQYYQYIINKLYILHKNKGHYTIENYETSRKGWVEKLKHEPHLAYSLIAPTILFLGGLFLILIKTEEEYIGHLISLFAAIVFSRILINQRNKNRYDSAINCIVRLKEDDIITNTECEDITAYLKSKNQLII